MCRISSGGGSQKFKPLKARVTAMYCTPRQTRSTLLEKRRASSRSMSLGAECVASPRLSSSQLRQIGPIMSSRTVCCKHGQAFGGRAIALASRMAFGTQRSGRDKNLDPSSGNVVDKAGDEEFAEQERIGLHRGDIDNHGLIGVGNCQCVEFRRSDAEILCEQIQGVDEAVDATIGVMQDNEVPSGTDFTTAGFGDDSQHPPSSGTLLE